MSVASRGKKAIEVNKAHRDRRDHKENEGPLGLKVINLIRFDSEINGFYPALEMLLGIMMNGYVC